MIAADLVRAGLVLFCLLVSSKETDLDFLPGRIFNVCHQPVFLSRLAGALLPLIVKEEQDWLTANGLMQIIQTVGLLAGPALAGFAIGLWGEKVAFVVNCCGFCVSAIAVSFIRMEAVNKSAVLQPAEECLDGPSTNNTAGDQEDLEGITRRGCLSSEQSHDGGHHGLYERDYAGAGGHQRGVGAPIYSAPLELVRRGWEL